jgi:hypothetical protein
MVSTFLTMVYVPVVYSLFEDGQAAARRLLANGQMRPLPNV